MIGRLDDWMRVLVERDGIAVHPDALDWAGIAAFKRAVRRLSASAATGRGCWPRPTGTACTGPSWSAATSC